MKLKIFALKVFMMVIICPLIKTFMFLFSRGHFTLGAFCILAVFVIAGVIVGSTIGSIKSKLNRSR